MCCRQGQSIKHLAVATLALILLRDVLLLSAVLRGLRLAFIQHA